MTRDDPQRRLLDDLVRVKRERNLARARVQTLAGVLEQVQAELVLELVRGRLLRVEDFGLHIGMAAVLDESGRLDRRLLELRVSDLLRRRPELAFTQAPRGRVDG